MAKTTEAFFERYCVLRATGWTVDDLEKSGIDCRFLEQYYQKFKMGIRV